MKVFYLLLFSAFLFSCNNPLSKTYSVKTYNEDMQVIRESKKISYEDEELLSKYIVVSQLAGNDLQGKSYNEILDKIKEIRKSNTAESDQQKMEQEQKRERMSSVMAVSLTDKKFTTNNNKELLTYTVSFHNITAQKINIVIGKLSINDLIDRPIKQIDIVLDEEITQGGTLKKIYTIPYNSTDENDKIIRIKDLTDLRVQWNPEKIVFSNGQVVQ